MKGGEPAQYISEKKAIELADTWLVADYFDDFRCKCGDCRHSCCGGWRIAVGEEEYFRIIGMDCSDELHHKIEGAFVRPEFPTKERYMLMEADWTGRCRMLGEDGLCMLQKECGEDAITEVCRVYPRSYKSENGKYNACCSASCEAVVERLLRTQPLTFRTESEEQISHGKHVKPEISEKQDIDINTLFGEVVKVLQNRTISLAGRIGIIAGKTGLDFSEHGIRTKIEKEGLYNTILPILEEFGEEAPSSSTYVEEFKKRYSQRSSEESKKKSSQDGAEESPKNSSLSSAEDTCRTFEEKFEADRKAFEEAFPDWSSYFENLICNNMLYSSFPAVDHRVEPREAIFGLSLQYTLLRVMCICHTAECGYTMENLVDVIAEVYHVVEHTAFYYNSMVLLNR